MDLSRRGVAFVAFALLSVFSTLVTAALPTIEVKGSKFFTKNGDQFYIKGVAYQANVNQLNNLVNGTQCRIDAKLMATLGANVLRTYTVEPTLNHDECMAAFDDAGIYVMVDMATPEFSINRADPVWDVKLRNEFSKVLDGFHKYDNLLGFFVGNEVVNDAKTSNAARYVKAALADMKAYRDLMRYRNIPIGYSASYNFEVLEASQQYFVCGDTDISADFYSMNMYSWCPGSSFEKAGYDKLYEQAENYPVPIFLSETGCRNDTTNGEPNRDWEDQIDLLGRKMNDRYSGSIIYEWSMQENEYGIVKYDNDDALGNPKLLGDYSRLSKQWAGLTPVGVQASAYDPSLTAPACPGTTSGGWSLAANDKVPTIGTSGWTAPPTFATTTSGEAANTGAATASSSNGGEPNPTSEGIQLAKSASRTGSIVGGVIGGVVLLALIGAAIWWFRRKKRNRGAPLPSEEIGADSDKMVAGSDNHKNGYYGPTYHELHGYGQTQELDPNRGQVSTLNANEMPNGQGLDGELPHAAVRYNDNDPLPPPPSTVRVEQNVAERPSMDPSPHVQAQRQRELEWLESEEQRLRDRRDLLRQQQQGP